VLTGFRAGGARDRGPNTFYTDSDMTDRTHPTKAPKIDPFCLGPYQTNCYIIHGETPEGESSCWVADFSFESEPLLEQLERDALVPEALVLTHAHVDHIAGLGAAKRRFPDAPILIHEAERDWLTDANLNLSGFSPNPVTAPPADRLLADGDTLSLAGRAWRVLHTPGHSPGSVSLFCEEAGVCICGDAIFKGSVGRTDFPGCSFAVLERSIRDKIYALPDETVLLPGHGPATTVGDEKRTNPFVPG